MTRLLLVTSKTMVSMAWRWWLAAALGTCGTAWAGSPDWPQWGRTNDRNMAAPLGGVPATMPDRPAWELEVGEFFSSPAIGQGMVVLGSKNLTLWCLEATTGKSRWVLRRTGVRGRDAGYGICSTALIEGDRVYAVTAYGELLCLDAHGLANGNDGPFTDEAKFLAGDRRRPAALKDVPDPDILWVFDIPAEMTTHIHDAFASSPLIEGGLLYVGTSNSVGRPERKEDVLSGALHYWDPQAKNGQGTYIGQTHDQARRPDAPSLIVLDKLTGRLVGRDDEKIGRRLFHGQWSSPTAGRVNGRTLIFYGGGDGVCYAFEPPDPAPRDGQVQVLKKAWACDCNPPDYRLDEQGRQIGYSKFLRSEDLFPNLVRERGPAEITGTPVFYDGKVYVAIGGEHCRKKAGALTCIDAGTGRKLWQTKAVPNSFSTAAIADGLLFITDYLGGLNCLDAATGELCWTHRVGQSEWDSPVVLGDKVFFHKYVFACARTKQLLGDSFPGTPYPGSDMLLTQARNATTLRAYALTPPAARPTAQSPTPIP